MSSTQTLKTPREFLTSLMLSLNSHHLSSTNATNPLHNAPPQIRSLIATLHVIYPQLLLPALDLLDRQLVTKIILDPSLPSNDTTVSAHEHPPDAAAALAQPQQSISADPTAVLYTVQSSQPTSSRSRSTTEKHYLIRLPAWNCTCVSFAFSAFPGPTGTSSLPPLSNLPDLLNLDINLPSHPEEEGREMEWEFGGLSIDGKGGGAVPACKHLLAAVLADRWEVVGGLVKERGVGREEFAGLGAGF